MKISYQIDEINEKLRKLEEKLNQKSPLLEKRIKDISEEIEDLKDEIAIANKKLEELKLLREREAKNVPEDLLSFYEEARRKFDNLVVASAEGGACQGCGMKLPNVLFSKLVKANTVERCPGCGRFLVYCF